MAFHLGQPMQLLGCPRDLIYMPTVWNGWNIVDKTMSLKPSKDPKVTHVVRDGKLYIALPIESKVFMVMYKEGQLVDDSYVWDDKEFSTACINSGLIPKKDDIFFIPHTDIKCQIVDEKVVFEN